MYRGGVQDRRMYVEETADYLLWYALFACPLCLRKLTAPTTHCDTCLTVSIQQSLLVIQTDAFEHAFDMSANGVGADAQGLAMDVNSSALAISLATRCCILMKRIARCGWKSSAVLE